MKKIFIITAALFALLVGNAWALGPYHVAAGATSQEVTIYIGDSTDTATPETGVTYDNVDHLYYRRSGTNDKVAITPDTVAVDGAWTTGGFVHIDGGLYRLCVPDAAFVAGAANVTIWGDETDMVIFPITVLIAPPVGAAASVTGAVGSVAGNVDGNVSGTVTLANGAHGGAAATLVLSDYSAFKATGFSTHTAANVVDEFETQSQADPTGFHVNVLEVGGTSQTANDNGADINSILLDTGTDGVLLAVDSIKKVTFDEATAWPLLSADTGSTQIARVGADSDTLETLSDQLDVVTTDTDELQTELADGGRTDLILDAILLDTGTTLPADLAPKGGNKLFP